MALKQCFFLIFAGMAIAVKSTVGYDTQDSQGYRDLPCLSVGGLCVLSTDCPKGQQVPVKGLCPLQGRDGVECCYSLPMSETRCQKRGGQCIRKNQQCPENLTFLRASDCSVDQKCCILV